MSLATIEIDDEVFTEEGAVGFGAVRKVQAKQLVVYIEGYGDIVITAEQIASAHDGKVLLKPETLPPRLQAHLEHVHDGEIRGTSET
ncbi:hypothetical protein [Jannaschia marina]|uniref:hypothetical protein n=1 Tax=Jannaschia marina TaxID=2741674 RepID=UPI0015CDD0F7|nr:hypothetical protein [Jannaschia marina]